VPLGHDYVELVGVVDRSEAAASDFGRPVMEAVASGDRLVGWAVATDDLHSVASRLNLEVVRGSRTRPDGSTLRWQLAGVARSLVTGAFAVLHRVGRSARASPWRCRCRPSRDTSRDRVGPGRSRGGLDAHVAGRLQRSPANRRRAAVTLGGLDHYP